MTGAGPSVLVMKGPRSNPRVGFESGKSLQRNYLSRSAEAHTGG